MAEVATKDYVDTAVDPSGYTPKLYVYLPDYKPQSEIDTMISTEIAANGKFWGVMWENFRFASNGDPIFVDTAVSGGSNMGFSAGNKTRVLNFADNILCGLAGDISGSTEVTAMLADAGKRNAAITAIANHVDTEGFAGVNINFEPIPDLSGAKLTNFKTFVTDLRTALKADNPNALMSFAGHIIWDSSTPGKEFSGVNYTGESTMPGTNYMAFTLNDMEDLGFDIIEMQAYDQFYDFGARELGITTYDQVGAAIDLADRRISHDKISIIIGTYAVRLPDGDDVYGGVDLNNATRAQVTAADATFYSTAARQSGRGYLIKSVSGGKQILAPDQKTIDEYYRICKNKRLQYVGFWLAGDYYYPSLR